MKCWYCGLDIVSIPIYGYVHAHSGQKWVQRSRMLRHEALPTHHTGGIIEPTEANLVGER